MGAITTRALVPAIVVAALFAAIADGSGAAPRSFPGKNGVLVFDAVDNTNGTVQIFRVSAGGTGLKQLTTTKGMVWNEDPVLSANGQTIYFDSLDRATTRPSHIYRMNQNGTGRQLADKASAPTHVWPSVNRSGTSLAVVQYGKSGRAMIATMKTSGAHRKVVAKATRLQGNGSPEYAPNNGRIAFYRVTYKKSGHGFAKSNLFIRENGRNINITAHSSAKFFAASWAPNGRRLLAIRGQRTIVSMRPNGSGVRALTKVSGAHTGIDDAVYSPDGKKIAYLQCSGDCGDPRLQGQGSIWVMNANGSGKHRVFNGGNGEQPANRLSWGGQTPKAVPCSAAALIRAIRQANAGGGGHLRLSSKCTYTLTAAQTGTEDGLPPIQSSITIDGRGATITRSTDARTRAFRIFEVLGRGHLILHSLTISRGDAPGPGPDGGGGIEVRAQGSLFARSVVVRGNVGALGGGVNNFGTTAMSKSVVAGNQALHGGGVSNSTRSGKLKLINTLILRNKAESDAGVAGGVYNQEGGSARLVNVSIKKNVASNSGGGIRNDFGSVMEIAHSQVSQNRAGPLVHAPTTSTGGGIQNLGRMAVRHTTVQRNHVTKIGPPTKAYGGGMANLRSDTQGASGPHLLLINSRITHNVADTGAGGIYNDHGSVTLRHTSVRHNVPTNCSGSPTPVPRCSG